MIHPKFMEKFFHVKTKASKELEDKVKAELETPDPPAEQAAAVLNKKDASCDDSPGS